MRNRASLLAIVVFGITNVPACSKGEGGGGGGATASGKALTSHQLAQLAPMKVGELELDTGYLSLANPRLAPDARMATVAYHHDDEQIVVRFEDHAEKPSTFKANRNYVEGKLTQESQNVESSEDGDVYRWFGMKGDVPHARLMIGGRFEVQIHGRDGTPMSMLQEFVGKSDLLEKLKRAPAEPGPDEAPAWATSTGSRLGKPPVRKDARGWCAEWIPDGLVAKHCGTELALELSDKGDTEKCEVVAKQGKGGGSKDKITVGVRKAKPERWDGAHLEYPPEPIVDDRNKVATWVSFSSYPNIVRIYAAKREPICTHEQLLALAGEIKQQMPPAEEAPEVREIPDCATLLTASDVEQICGKSITVKSSGMDDGVSNVCNHNADGLIFLLSRHGSPDTARQGARVASGENAELGDGEIHISKQADGGFTAVAPVRNLLLELKSVKEPLTDDPIPCTKEKLKKLAEKVIGRVK